MKNKLYVIIFLISFLLYNFSGCSENPSTIQKATLPEGLVTTKDLGPALSVKQIKDHNGTSKYIVVKGFIGGRKRPFTENRAVFIIGDESLETCDERPGDNCPTPWDVCCEDRKKVASSTISVQVLDSNGTLLHGTLEDVSGIQAGKKVKVEGHMEKKSKSPARIFNAVRIQLLNN